MTKKIADLGCGPKKTPGAVGIDIYPYPGVDVVCDLDVFPWPMPTDDYDGIVCRHVIEHIADPVAFMSEVHRIAKNGAVIEFYTPHFSSVNSWADLTHRRHLSLHWYLPFTVGGYLAPRTGTFELVSTAVSFSRSSLRGRIALTIAALLGQDRWEKHYAFRWPGRDITTLLRVVKQSTTTRAMATAV